LYFINTNHQWSFRIEDSRLIIRSLLFHRAVRTRWEARVKIRPNWRSKPDWIKRLHNWLRMIVICRTMEVIHWPNKKINSISKIKLTIKKGLVRKMALDYMVILSSNCHAQASSNLSWETGPGSKMCARTLSRFISSIHLCATNLLDKKQKKCIVTNRKVKELCTIASTGPRRKERETQVRTLMKTTLLNCLQMKTLSIRESIIPMGHQVNLLSIKRCRRLIDITRN